MQIYVELNLPSENNIEIAGEGGNLDAIYNYKRAYFWIYIWKQNIVEMSKW